jgi:dipeptidyl aminopeptidase/acylaminoacyl peptidase
MQRPHTRFFVVAVAIALATEACAVEPANVSRSPFSGRIVMIGAGRTDDPKVSLIATMSPDGSDVRTLYRVRGRSIFSGRVSPDGSRLAFSCEGEIWVLDSAKQTRKIADNGGFITAWSPDGRQIAFYREAASAGAYAWESFLIDVTTKQQTKLPLSPDYEAEDWHPQKQLRTLIYWNPGKWIHLKGKRDRYPVRQLCLLAADGKKTALTKDPSFDNIWSRFSPSGDRIAHYRRRFVDGRPREYAVVCDADGSRAKEVLGFTDIGDAAGLERFKPTSFPAWSPDGKTIAWVVSTRDKSIGDALRYELVVISVDDGSLRRMSLTEKGFVWVTAIDWR